MRDDGKRYLILAATLLFAILGALQTAQAGSKFLVFGVGTVSCGEWQQYRTTGDLAVRYQAQAWVDGFLSGYNKSADQDILDSQPSPVALYAWIDNYCVSRPLDRLSQAAGALIFELTEREKRGRK
jgi:hypothetical protein